MHYQRLPEHRKRITSRRVLQVSSTLIVVVLHFISTSLVYCYVFQFMAVCLMLVLLPLTAKALAKFLEALFHRLREFELAISVDKADCFVILWTRKNKNEYDVIRNLSSVEELSNTHFNR